MMDGFQECLHCQFAHPGLSKLYPPTFYHVVNHQNWSRHFSNPDRDDDGLFLYFFPTTTLNMYNGGMSTFRVCPSSEPGKSRMEFDYYQELTGERFEEYYRFVREVADEDTHLCELTQSNLEKGIYSEGYLNPEKEVGVIRESSHVVQNGYRAKHSNQTTNKRFLTWLQPSILGTRGSWLREEGGLMYIR